MRTFYWEKKVFMCQIFLPDSLGHCNWYRRGMDLNYGRRRRRHRHHHYYHMIFHMKCYIYLSQIDLQWKSLHSNWRCIEHFVYAATNQYKTKKHNARRANPFNVVKLVWSLPLLYIAFESL